MQRQERDDRNSILGQKETKEMVKSNFKTHFLFQTSISSDNFQTSCNRCLICQISHACKWWYQVIIWSIIDSCVNDQLYFFFLQNVFFPTLNLARAGISCRGRLIPPIADSCDSRGGGLPQPRTLSREICLAKSRRSRRLVKSAVPVGSLLVKTLLALTEICRCRN